MSARQARHGISQFSLQMTLLHAIMKMILISGHNEETEARLTKIWKSSWSADAVVQNNDENIIFKVIGD